MSETRDCTEERHDGRHDGQEQSGRVASKTDSRKKTMPRQSFDTAESFIHTDFTRNTRRAGVAVRRFEANGDFNTVSAYEHRAARARVGRARRAGRPAAVRNALTIGYTWRMHF